MAVSRVKVWTTEILYASDLNAEFNNILNNGTDVAFPLTKSVSGGGFAVDNLSLTAILGIAFSSGLLKLAKSANIASAATTDLSTATGNFVHITGTTTITAFGSLTAGTTMVVTFDGILTLTHNGTSLILPTAANITTAAGDLAVMVSESAGNWRCVVYARASGQSLVAGTAGAGITISGPTITKVDETQLLENIGFTAAVAANALTFTLTAKDGTTLTTSNVARIWFRSSTLTTGQGLVRSVTSAITLVVPSGATLGTTNGVAARLYLLAIDNAGTVELAVWNPLNATGPILLGINESGLITTTTIGGASNSAQVGYSTTGRASVSIRILGYIEISEATAGTWATAPTVLQIMGPGVPRTGDIIQVAQNSTGAVATGTTTVPDDDTIPQSTEGDQYMSQAITPTSAINQLQIDITANWSSSVNVRHVLALFQDATASALAAVMDFTLTTAQASKPSVLRWVMAAGTTSATTFKLRMGPTAAGTVTFNGDTSARKMGGAMASFMRVTEIFV